MKFNRDKMNMFNVMSRAGRSKKEGGGIHEGGSSRLEGGKEGVCQVAVVVSVLRWRDEGLDLCVMKIISWNVRGFGAFEKRKEVCKLVGEKLPPILCIQETKFCF